MTTFHFRDEILLPARLDEVFGFFADASNLENLTPPWLRFKILTESPIHMTEGTLIDYRIRWRGIPLRWRTKIESWQPPHRFVDHQISGPYRLWRHEHLFRQRKDGTSIEDRVEYSPLGGAIAQRLAVGRDVKQIFSYRRAALVRIFGTVPIAC